MYLEVVRNAAKKCTGIFSGEQGKKSAQRTAESFKTRHPALRPDVVFLFDDQKIIRS